MSDVYVHKSALWCKPDLINTVYTSPVDIYSISTRYSLDICIPRSTCWERHRSHICMYQPTMSQETQSATHFCQPSPTSNLGPNMIVFNEWSGRVLDCQCQMFVYINQHFDAYLIRSTLYIHLQLTINSISNRPNLEHCILASRVHLRETQESYMHVSTHHVTKDTVCISL